jgi:hypothetical protein
VSRLLLRLTLALVALLPLSCGSGSTLYPVEGSVFYNGHPAVGAQVIFFPETNDSLAAMIPSTVVEADGTFKLNTNGQPGAPAGKYKVVVQVPLKDGSTAKKAAMGGESEKTTDDKYVQGSFANRESTTLTAEVKSSATKLEPFRIP